jgi:hypothetical protein
MKLQLTVFIIAQLCINGVLADDGTAVPDWAKYPFFFLGAALIASAGWFFLCCCCLPCTGLKFKLVIILLFSALIGLWAYFLFGPWWTDLNTKEVVTKAVSF